MTGNTDEPVGPVGPDGKKLKPCSSCLETRKPRDECISIVGEENCRDAIEAHKACMRALGFKLPKYDPRL